MHKEVAMSDLLDERLIELLSQDARQSSQALAKQLNVSSSTVRRRISKLVKRGVLRFAALAEPAEFGFNLRAIIAFDVEHDKVREVMEVLRGRSEVKGLAATSGSRFSEVPDSDLPRSVSLLMPGITSATITPQNSTIQKTIHQPIPSCQCHMTCLHKRLSILFYRFKVSREIELLHWFHGII